MKIEIFIRGGKFIIPTNCSSFDSCENSDCIFFRISPQKFYYSCSKNQNIQRRLNKISTLVVPSSFSQSLSGPEWEVHYEFKDIKNNICCDLKFYEYNSHLYYYESCIYLLMEK